MTISVPLQLFAGGMVGLLCTAVHLALLRWQVERAWDLQAAGARAMVLRGFPVRMLLWLPAVALTLWLGWLACVALVASLIIGRWALLAVFVAGQRGQSGASERGC